MSNAKDTDFFFLHDLLYWYIAIGVTSHLHEFIVLLYLPIELILWQDLLRGTYLYICAIVSMQCKFVPAPKVHKMMIDDKIESLIY